MRLLLVEDDHDLARGLKDRLAQAGFAVDYADNGIDGAFLGGDTAYDCIILDLGLPGRPGLSVLRDWRAAAMHSPVLILTARDAWHERVDGLKAGGVGIAEIGNLQWCRLTGKQQQTVSPGMTR